MSKILKAVYNFTIQQGEIVRTRIIDGADAKAFLVRLADAKLNTKGASIFIVDVLRCDGVNVRNVVLKEFYKVLQERKALKKELESIPSFNSLEDAMLAVS